MKRFRFSLEVLLKVRRGREERVKKEFSGILERRATCLREIAFLERALEGSLLDEKEQRRQGLSSGQIQIFESSRKARLESIAWKQVTLSSIDEEMERKRLELVEASRETKVLEKLEEGQWLAYSKKLNREEQSYLDELASHRSLQEAGTF